MVAMLYEHGAAERIVGIHERHTDRRLGQRLLDPRGEPLGLKQIAQISSSGTAYPWVYRLGYRRQAQEAVHTAFLQRRAYIGCERRPFTIHRCAPGGSLQ